MSPRDLYSMDTGEENGESRGTGNPVPKPQRFTEPYPDGERDLGEPREYSDLDIEKKFLQLTRIDTEQFKFFYEKYHDVIFDYVFWKTGDYELTGDLTGDVFLEALNKLDSFTWQGYSFGAWLFHLARRIVGKHYRRVGHPAEKVFEDRRRESNQPRTPIQKATRNQDLELIRLCMQHLSSDRNDALVFHYWLGLPVREIALVMKTSESNVKQHLVRGRREMLKWFKENGLDLGLSKAGQRMIREIDAYESGWHLVDDLNNY